MVELWLVRHGQSEGNRFRRYQGQAHGLLSPLGHEQAEQLCLRLAQIHRRNPFVALYSSDLRRAMETAQPVALALGLPIQTKVGLREIDVGRWSGLTFEEIAQQYPDEWAAFQLSTVDPELARGGGESYEEAQQRIADVLTRIALRHDGERVLIFSHGGVLRAYIADVLGLPLANLRRIIMDNTAISRVQLFRSDESTDGFVGRLVTMNDTSHWEEIQRGDDPLDEAESPV